MYGSLMALGSALLWALAVLAFEQAGRRFTPWQLNLFKGASSLLLLSLTALVTRTWPWHELTPLSAVGLALSGLLGITLGDTAYFAALQRLGTRRTLLLGILSPPISAVLGWLFLGEVLPPLAWAGIVLTLGGVAWVIGQRQPEDGVTQVRAGVLYGLLAMVAQAIGALITRGLLSGSAISPLTSALMRLSVSTVALALGWRLMAAGHQGGASPTLTWRDEAVRMAFLGTFLGTYIAMLTYMSALKYAAVGIVQTLLTTSQLWGLGLAALRRERIPASAVAGALLATLGVVLLVLG